MPSISSVYIFQEIIMKILHRRFYYENTESIFGAPYKNNPTTLSQEHEPSLLKCAIPR